MYYYNIVNSSRNADCLGQKVCRSYIFFKYVSNLGILVYRFPVIWTEKTSLKAVFCVFCVI